ncbi:endonuclease SmrB [Neiella marina]|uniref:Ribosome rescue factor SmrB n=1 Tax=Neiella holothuriorum TaxID=2870530 RepID=A0ABS7EDL7_9GAMM|nr:endonuclease SmrB [Neiella holothuriorum]MBW8190423.1 endonuclease SmrB [Neiella holothuriorum]
MTPSDDDELEFRQLMADVKQLRQDTISHTPQRTKKRSDKVIAQQQEAVREAEFFFSDTYEAHFAEPERISWLSEQAPADAAKQLKRGQLQPDLMLDLHGMTQAEAKLELAALLASARRQRIQCVSVMTGLGTGILKNRLPHWLVQHPDVQAFCQAPRNWGGRSALLVLLHVDELM